ncbi:hypothetical protein [Cardinium endosymbiont of Oedothorax gibbosus]|nr:hypothetical protein [Cardinium endosymbiont of Oedothorax gibbosus]
MVYFFHPTISLPVATRQSANALKRFNEANLGSLLLQPAILQMHLKVT